MIRVLVWASSAIRRNGLESLVAADTRLRVLDVGSRFSDLRNTMRDLTPDVVLLDGEQHALRWPSIVGVPHALVLVEDAGRNEVRHLLQLGIRGVLTANAEPAEVQAAIASVHEGLAVFSPEILETLLPIGAGESGRDEFTVKEALTERETQVLALLAEGAGNKEIGARLHVSEHTVKFHVSSILAKLGAATRTEAVTRGYRRGLILM